MNKTLLPAAALLALALPGARAADIPESAVLRYATSYGVPATMTFKRSGSRYTVSASIDVPLYSIRFESGGTISGRQLKPAYYHDIRNGKTYASARFSGRTATYGRSGELRSETVSGTVMDLFTLSWQLALNEGRLPARLTITNGKKLYAVGGISPSGSSRISIGGTPTPVSQFTVRRGGDTVQYAFAPALGNVPAVIRYNDGDKSYHLTLRSLTVNGRSVRP